MDVSGDNYLTFKVKTGIDIDNPANLEKVIVPHLSRNRIQLTGAGKQK